MASSWEILALRFMGSSPFLVVLEVRECPVNVRRLFSFVATAEKQYTNSAEHRVIDPVAGSPSDPQLAETMAQRLRVAKIPGAVAMVKLSELPVLEGRLGLYDSGKEE